LYTTIQALFRNRVKDDEILVEKIAILLFDMDKKQWFIHKEIVLKKN
jgi:hypothetical protein